MRDGKLTEACPMLEESQRLDPAVGTEYNLAECDERAGKTASAWALFLDVAATTKAAGQTAREQVARERAAALAPKLVKLLITVPANPPEGLEIRRDGVPVGRTQWGIALPVDPGAHTLAVTAPGYKPYKTSFTLAGEGQTTAMAIPAFEAGEAGEPLPDARDADGAPARPTAPAHERREDRAPAPNEAGLGTQRALAIVAAGVGVVGLGVGSVFGLESLSKHKESVNLGCSGSTCTPEGGLARNDAIDDGNVSTAAFVIGVLGVAAGAVLWLTAPPAHRSASPSASVALAPLPGGAALVGSW